MTRIPREFTVQDNLDMAKHFEFNTATNPDVAIKRRSLRGLNVNIIDDQSAGIEVGINTLRELDDPESQRIWARLFGGAMLNSALYMYRDARSEPMSRNLKLPEVFHDDVLLDNDTRRVISLYRLSVLRDASKRFEGLRAERAETDKQTYKLARNLGNTAMWVGIFGSDFSDNSEELAIMSDIREQETEINQSTQKLANLIGFNPSLAQLRSESTPLGSHIVQSDESEVSMSIKGAFRSAVADLSKE